MVGVLGGDAELGGGVDEAEGVVFGEAVDGGLVAGGELVGRVRCLRTDDVRVLSMGMGCGSCSSCA